MFLHTRFNSLGLVILFVTAGGVFYCFYRWNAPPQIPFLSPHCYRPCHLVSKVYKNRDTLLLRFQLPPHMYLGLPLGQHLFLKAQIHGKEVIRPYTPISAGGPDQNYFDLLLKVYFKDSHPAFPQGGVLSQFLHEIPVGARLEARGPFGKILYQGAGHYTLTPHRRGHCLRIGMIAGGSGLTPMFQLLQAMRSDPTDPTEVVLLYANNTLEDIWCRKELEILREKDPHRLKLFYTLLSPPAVWSGYTGFVNQTMLQETLPTPGQETLVLLCGPPPMVRPVRNLLVQNLGYSSDRLLCF